MKFSFSEQERNLLKNVGVFCEETNEYTEDEALDLLDRLREAEVSYAQFNKGHEASLYLRYGELADKLYAQIPD